MSTPPKKKKRFAPHSDLLTESIRMPTQLEEVILIVQSLTKDTLTPSSSWISCLMETPRCGNLVCTPLQLRYTWSWLQGSRWTSGSLFNIKSVNISNKWVTAYTGPQDVSAGLQGVLQAPACWERELKLTLNVIGYCQERPHNSNQPLFKSGSTGMPSFR